MKFALTNFPKVVGEKHDINFHWPENNSSVPTFKKKLKTYLFKEYFNV